MTPADIDRHTAETRELLKDASYKPVDPRVGCLNPYQAQIVPGPSSSEGMTFAWAFMWSPEAEKQRAAWDHLIHGFKLCLAEIYPEHKVVEFTYTIDSPQQVALILAQFYAKMRRSIRGNLTFIEVDVVCNRKCNPFEADFDIGIPDCKDRWAMMPFNPGVMFAKDTPGAQRFLDTAMEYACDMPGNFPLWYAYQLALAQTWHALKDVVNIKIFPHEEYNWSPDAYAPSDAYFIHLKGQRKLLQRDYVVHMLDGGRGRFILPK